MKKLIIAIVAIGFAAGFQSCKKDYTCSCVSSINGISSPAVKTTIKDTKSKATETCIKGNSSIDLGGIVTTTICTLD